VDSEEDLEVDKHQPEVSEEDTEVLEVASEENQEVDSEGNQESDSEEIEVATEEIEATTDQYQEVHTEVIEADIRINTKRNNTNMMNTKSKAYASEPQF